jgi:hypothetical protein
LDRELKRVNTQCGLRGEHVALPWAHLSPKERAENGPDVKIEDKGENRHSIKGGERALVGVDKYKNTKIPYERRG